MRSMSIVMYDCMCCMKRYVSDKMYVLYVLHVLYVWNVLYVMYVLCVECVRRVVT